MKKYFKQILYISIVFLIYLSIVNTEMAILNQLLAQKGNQWVGQAINALFFLGSSIGALKSSYIQEYHYKWLFMFGSLGMLGYMCFSVFFLKYGFPQSMTAAFLILSFFFGTIYSVFYNAQFNYVNGCSKVDKQSIKYFGYNLGIVQSSNILGSTFSAMLIKPLGQQHYVMFMLVVLTMTTSMFLFVKDVKYIVQEKVVDEDKGQLAQKTQLKKKQENKQSPYQLAFCYIFSGIILSFVVNEISKVMYTKFKDLNQVELNRQTFVILIYQGLGQLVGGIYIIFISSKFGSHRKQFVMTSNIYLISLAIFYISSISQNMLFLHISVFFIGICNCICISLAISMAGEWNQKGISSFSLLQGIGMFVFILIPLFVSLQTLIILSVVVHFLSTISLISSKTIK